MRRAELDQKMAFESNARAALAEVASRAPKSIHTDGLKRLIDHHCCPQGYAYTHPLHVAGSHNDTHLGVECVQRLMREGILPKGQKLNKDGSVDILPPSLEVTDR